MFTLANFRSTYVYFSIKFVTRMSKSGSQTSQTLVATTNNTETEDSTIVITARAPERRPRVQFTADTVDNEGMGKKSSKGKK